MSIRPRRCASAHAVLLVGWSFCGASRDVLAKQIEGHMETGAVIGVGLPVSAPVHWYGGPAVASDVISFALIAGGGSGNNAGLLMLGAAGYGLGAPINHLANGHPQRALESLGIRLLGGVAAVGVFMLDVLSHPCDGEPSCHHTPSVGLAAGAVLLLAAATVDDALLARELTAAPRPGATLAPAVVVGSSSAFVSLGGSF